MQIEVGRSYFNRAGAIVRVAEIRSTGYFKRDPLTWEIVGPAALVICEVERPLDPGRSVPGSRYALHDSGFYLPMGEHELDLVRQVEEVTA